MMKIFFKSIYKFLRKPILRKIFLILIILTLLGTWQIKNSPKNVFSTSLPTPTTAAAYQDFHLIIPKININAPIIADVDGTDKDTYFKALENGVAHFKGTAKPGEGSNIFIFGHSSFYAWAAGDYKEIFKELENVKEGDEIVIWYNNKEYKYKVADIKIVDPDEVNVLKATSTEQVSLMTCVPPGTTLKRLIVVGKPVF